MALSLCLAQGFREALQMGLRPRIRRKGWGFHL